MNSHSKNAKMSWRICSQSSPDVSGMGGSALAVDVGTTVDVEVPTVVVTGSLVVGAAFEDDVAGGNVVVEEVPPHPIAATANKPTTTIVRQAYITLSATISSANPPVDQFFSRSRRDDNGVRLDAQPLPVISHPHQTGRRPKPAPVSEVRHASTSG